MQLRSLSVAYACQYHNHTMGQSVHNVTYMTPYMLSAICSVQLKLGLICEERTSEVCQWPSKVSICPSQYANCTVPVLCDKTAHFRVAFYCPQHKVHLCNDNAV